MTPTTSAPGFESRLECFLGHIGEELPRSDLRRKFALYTLGLFSEAERKSIEPLAAQTRPEAPDAARLAMLHFVANAPWDDRAVRRALAWALWGATARSPVRSAEYEVPADLRAYVERVVELASHVALPPDLDADLVRLAPGADVPAELRRRGSVGGGKGADGGARPLPRRRNRHPGRPPHA